MSSNALPKAKNPDFPVIKRLLSERWRKLAPRYFLAFAFMGITAACTASAAYLMKDLINKVFVEKNAGFITLIAGAIVVLYTVKGLASYAYEVILSRTGNRIIADTQRRMYDRLLTFDLSFFHTMPVGDLVTRITYNAQATREVLNLLVAGIGRDLFTLIGLVIVMVVQDPLMSAMAFFVAPIVFLVLSRIMKKVRKLFTREVASVTAIASTVQETAQGARVIKAFGLEDAMRARMDEAVTSVEKLNNRMSAAVAQSNPLIDTLGGFAVAAIVLYGGWRVVDHGASPGEFFSFITALLMAHDPARRLSKLNVALAGASVGVRMMYELMDRQPAVADAPDAAPLRLETGGIALQDVSFAYGERGDALKAISLDFAPGKMTALVGASGSGKSTVLNLILRFWDPQSGTVSIDGQDLRGVTLASLRASIALVSQEVFLFAGTIRENIRQGRPGASDDEIVAASRAAQAHDFIMAMPQGYDTDIGEAGALLSGGQRQRISIARAFLKDAAIILLDEPTSALDAESDAAIRVALAELTAGRTTVVIAHRLSTIAQADRIHVLEGGRLIECGTHAELMASSGTYARLSDLQTGADAA